MNSTGRLIYASPDRRGYHASPSPKQESWRKRVNLLWRIKGMIIPMDAPMTKEEKEKLSQAQTLIGEVIKDFTKSSIALGFNAVNRCCYCGKPAVTIDSRGHYVCEKCKRLYGTEQEIKIISDNLMS